MPVRIGPVLPDGVVAKQTTVRKKVARPTVKSAESTGEGEPALDIDAEIDKLKEQQLDAATELAKVLLKATTREQALEHLKEAQEALTEQLDDVNQALRLIALVAGGPLARLDFGPGPLPDLSLFDGRLDRDLVRRGASLDSLGIGPGVLRLVAGAVTDDGRKHPNEVELRGLTRDLLTIWNGLSRQREAAWGQEQRLLKAPDSLFELDHLREPVGDRVASVLDYVGSINLDREHRRIKKLPANEARTELKRLELQFKWSRAVGQSGEHALEEIDLLRDVKSKAKARARQAAPLLAASLIPILPGAFAAMPTIERGVAPHAESFLDRGGLARARRAVDRVSNERRPDFRGSGQELAALDKLVDDRLDDLHRAVGSTANRRVRSIERNMWVQGSLIIAEESAEVAALLLPGGAAVGLAKGVIRAGRFLGRGSIALGRYSGALALRKGAGAAGRIAQISASLGSRARAAGARLVGGARTRLRELARRFSRSTADDIAVDTNAWGYLDPWQPTPWTDVTRQILAGQNIRVPVPMLQEALKAGTAPKQVLRGLAEVGRSAKVIPRGSAAIEDAVRAVANSKTRRSQFDIPIGGAAARHGGRFATGDKALARALVESGQIPRSRIVSLTPDGIIPGKGWNPGMLALLGAVGAGGGIMVSSKPLPRPDRERQ